MAEPNLEQELIEQDELLNAFQVILKNQNSPGRTITRKKPTSLPLRSNLNTKVLKHSSICDYLKVKKTDTNRSIHRETRNARNPPSSSVSYSENIKASNKETVAEFRSNPNLKSDLLKVENTTSINDDDSSPSDYLTPATANYFPLGSQQPDMNRTTDISPQFEMDLSTNDSCTNTTNRNDTEITMVENNSDTMSGMDFSDPGCEPLKDDVYVNNKQGETTTKEEKERLNEEIAIQSSSLSSETGSWEPIFPAKNNIEIKQICSMFIHNEQTHTQSCNSAISIKQNITKSSAFFIDAKSLIDDTEVYLSYESNVQHLMVNNKIKKSISKESNNSDDTSNEDSLELEINNTAKRHDSTDTLSTQFPIDDAPVIEQPCVIPKTPENSILQLSSSYRPTDSPHRKQKFDECMPIISGGASIDDFGPQSVPICKSLPTSLDPNINNIQPPKEKFIHSWIVNYDNLDNRYNSPGSSSSEGVTKNSSSETKKSLGFYVDFSKVDSEDESTRESSKKSDKKIFSMYVDISDNKIIKSMPSSLNTNLKVRAETPKSNLRKKTVVSNLHPDSERSSRNSLESRKASESTSSKESTPKKEIKKRTETTTISKRVPADKPESPKYNSLINKNAVLEKSHSDIINIKEKQTNSSSIKNEKSAPIDIPVPLQSLNKKTEQEHSNNSIVTKDVPSPSKQILRNPTLQKSVKSSTNRHSWNLSSCSFEGGMQRVLYQTRKSASLSHCNLKDIQKGNISKKESNYSLSDISLGDPSYSRSEDSKTTDDTKDQNNESLKVKRKHRSDAKINETFDKSSTCSDKLTLTQDSTPTVTEQEDLTYHPEENETKNKTEEISEAEQKFVKLSDLDKLPIIIDNDDPIPLMTNSLPIPTQRNSKIMFHSLHVENLDKLARLFPDLKKELSRSSPESMALSFNSDKSSGSRVSKDDGTESSSTHTFISDLEYVFLHEIGADINIVVDNRMIRANKAILAARCSYFAAILATKDITEVVIDNYDYSVVHFALLHIYSGVRMVPATINIFLLAALADKWNLLDLKDIVSKILFSEVCHSLHRPCTSCTSNALRCFTISDNYNMDVLFKSILVWIGKHFEKIWLTDDFSKLPQHLMERCVRWVTSSIRVTNLTDILHKCECLQTSVNGVPRNVTCFLDHIINECTDYISTNLSLVLGDQSMLRLLYPPYKNGNLLEVVLFKGAQKSSPEKLCVAIKHTKKLMSLDCPGDSPFKKVLCRLLPHLEGTVIIKVHSIERIVDTSGWRELDLLTQERIKYFFRLIKKPTVIMVPPLCKAGNHGSQILGQDYEKTSAYNSRPVSRLRESSHIPILARDLEYVHISRSSTRPTGQIQPHKHNVQDIKKPSPRTIVKLKTGQTSSGRQSPGDKLFFNKNRSLSTNNEIHKTNSDTVNKGGKFNKQNRSHPNLSHKHTTNTKANNPGIDKPITQVKSLPGSVKQSPPVTIQSKISPDTSQSSKASTGTKCSQHSKYHYLNPKAKITPKFTPSLNKPLIQLKKSAVNPGKQILQNKTGTACKTGPVKKLTQPTANKSTNQPKSTSKPLNKKKTAPSTSDAITKKDSKISKNSAEEKNKKITNNVNDDTSNASSDIVTVNDIPIMERSGTFLKDEPTILDKIVHTNY